MARQWYRDPSAAQRLARTQRARAPMALPGVGALFAWQKSFQYSRSTEPPHRGNL
jgi:hypothetical protein